jgi:predicted oxidoreductase
MATVKQEEKVKWWQVAQGLDALKYHIYPSRGEQVIAAPVKRQDGMRDTVVIPHKCCDIASAEVEKPHLRKIEEIFGVTPAQIIAAAGSRRVSK